MPLDRPRQAGRLPSRLRSLPGSVQKGMNRLRLIVRSPLLWSLIAATYLALTLMEFRRLPELRFFPLAGYCWATMVSWWVTVDEGMR
jgi:hypothetical protein